MTDQPEKKRKTVKKIFDTITAPATGSRKIKKALELSEEKYKSAFEYTQTGMMILEEDMTIALINRKISEMTGYSPDQIEGKRKWTELVYESDLSKMMGFHNKRRVDSEATPMQYEFQYKHTSGTLHDALITVSMIPGTDKSLVSMMDITERKKMEGDLRESERRFKETAELLPSIICEINMDLQFTYVNKTGLETFGFTVEDFNSGIPLTSIIEDSDLERAMKNISMKVAGEPIKPQEYNLRKKDGTIITCLVASSTMMKNDELVGIRISLIDITELKRVEQKLRLSEEHISSIYSASPIGIVLCNNDGTIDNANHSFKDMFSLADDIDYSHINFRLFKEIPGIKNKEKILAGGEGFSFESDFDFRFTEQDGRYEVISTKGRYLSWHITPLNIEGNGPAMLLGHVQDITERVKSEERRLNKVKHAAEEANKMVEGLKKEILNEATFHSIISRSPAMKEIFDIMPEIAQTTTTVLVTGESGTGKELIARSIHDLSLRAKAPFVAINCGALPDNLLESELFGYKAGAFTDAKKDKPGKFQLADTGTLFLDEIGDVTPAMQVKLLRALQEKTFEPLGDTKTVTVDVRIIAATNKNLPELVKNGVFREDLFYRIKVLNLSLPALRDRKCDIPLLCDHFISLFNARYKKSITELSTKALDCMLKHNFPGNIRELENIIEHAFIFCKTSVIEPKHLPQEIVNIINDSAVSHDILADIKSFDELERLFITKVLKENNGSRINTAKQLGIHKATLFRKMRSLGIEDN